MSVTKMAYGLIQTSCTMRSINTESRTALKCIKALIPARWQFVFRTMYYRSSARIYVSGTTVSNPIRPVRALSAMKKILVTAIFILVATVFVHDSLVFALEGQIGIHDPSTVILCDGKYYTYG